MLKKSIYLLFVILLLQCSYSSAQPRTVMVSAYSSSSWLPAAVNKIACEIVDHYLMNQYHSGVFDGSKISDKTAMAKRIGKDMDYVIIVELTAFYDPPHTTKHINSNISPEDTVATVILEYSVYIPSSDKWVKGRFSEQSIYQKSSVPIDTAYPEAVKKAMPKLDIALSTIVK